MSAAAAVPSPLKRTFVLAALLFVVFLIVTGLYARYGYAFALRVYEKQQLASSVNEQGKPRFVVYRDYLRVDPTNLYVRGLFINALIESNGAAEALVVAEEGVSAVSPEQQPIAKLLLARAQIARDKLDDAEATYKEVLEALALDGSGEAYCGLAHIAAARGNFDECRKQYQKYVPVAQRNATPDYHEKVSAAWRMEDYGVQDEYADKGDAFLITAAMHRLYSGNFQSSVDLLAKANDFSGAPPRSLFWRGVYEEEQGHRDAALDFYKRAAMMGDALGRFAAARLVAPPVAAETAPEK